MNSSSKMTWIITPLTWSNLQRTRLMYPQSGLLILWWWMNYFCDGNISLIFRGLYKSLLNIFVQSIAHSSLSRLFLYPFTLNFSLFAILNIKGFTIYWQENFSFRRAQLGIISKLFILSDFLKQLERKGVMLKTSILVLIFPRQLH